MPWYGCGMRLFLEMAAGHGLMAVALGAFGAHGLQKHAETWADAAKRLEWWQTASHYQLAHALALGLIGMWTRASTWESTPTALKISGWSFFIGALLFSGTLYLMTLSNQRWLGAITPLGGSLLLVGWAAMLWAAIQGA